ncbi:hypothetical protein D9M70_560390 [compost metagenome]
MLVVTLMLLTFMGDALRDAFDTRLGLAALRGRVEPKVPAGAPTGTAPGVTP